MDIKHNSHATESSTKSSDITIKSNLFFEETITDVGPPPKPNLFLHGLIP